MYSRSAWKVLWIAPLLVCPGLRGAERAAAARDVARLRPTRAEQLLPPETVAFLSVADYPAANKKWSQADFRPIWSNPALRAFLAQLATLFPRSWREPPGFPWPKLLDLPEGEACLALVADQKEQPAAVIILACRDRHQAAASFFAQLAASASRRAAAPTKVTVSGTEIVSYESLSYFFRDDLLVAASDPHLAAELAQRRPGDEGLIRSESWRAVAEQAAMNTEAADPDLRWFLRPKEFVNAFAKAKNSPVVGNTGLDLVRCAGGACWLAHGEQAALYRIGIFAPESGATGRKTLLSPDAELHDPPPWVPAAAAGYASFRCNLRRGVDAFGNLIEGAFGEPGSFADMLAAIKDDPNGPQVDLAAEVYQRLRSRVIILWGPEQPSAAWMNCGFALELTDAPRVARAIDRLCAKEPNVKKRPADKGTFYYTAIDDEEADGLDVLELPDISAPRTKRKPSRTGAADNASSKRPPESVGFSGVVHECLLEGIGKELLDCLCAAPRPLAETDDYRRVAEALHRLDANPVSGRGFSRNGDDFRLLAQCVTPVGVLCSLAAPNWFSPDQLKIAPRGQPPEACPSHCGPGGWVAHPTPQGCRVVGCVLANKTGK